jgi:hypothetical protein
MDTMEGIRTAYCKFCSNQESGLAKIQEYSLPDCPGEIKTFLEECRIKMQGQTRAWDLASLIVKPVQRVLKYPLLLKVFEF